MKHDKYIMLVHDYEAYGFDTAQEGVEKLFGICWSEDPTKCEEPASVLKAVIRLDDRGVQDSNYLMGDLFSRLIEDTENRIIEESKPAPDCDGGEGAWLIGMGRF